MKGTKVRDLAVSGDYLFVGTVGGGSSVYGINNIPSVWKRSISEMVTTVDKISTDLPAYFNLAQNYPNPFNPSTSIEFDIPSSGFVSLKVYNVRGQEIATLVNKELSPGNHKVEWNPQNISSGLYFYKLEAKGFIKTKKLVLMN